MWGGKQLLDSLLHNVAAVDSRIKDVPEMCDWIQGQQNANSINAFIIQELVPDWPTTKYWRLCATGTKTFSPASSDSLMCVNLLCRHLQRKGSCCWGSEKRFCLRKSGLHIILIKFVIVGLW